MKLKEQTKLFPETEIWNDSCSCKELSYAIENGACGATTNPVIVKNVLKNELSDWEDTIKDIIEENPEMDEDQISWLVIKALGLKASYLLLPQYNEFNGHRGRISFQTNAKFYKSKEKMLNQGIDLASVCENSQIKVPASKAGVEAMEELTYRGISVNATVSFTYPQAVAVAEAVERGLQRRKDEGKDVSFMNPVCTIMVGRLDDHLKRYTKENNMLVEPEILEHAGVIVAKKAYNTFKERGYTTKLLIAAFRNPYHWIDFTGGELVLTIPYKWQKLYNNSDYEISKRIDIADNEEYLNKLKKLDEFNKAYEEDGLKPEEFEHYGAFKATLAGFLQGYDELVSIIRKYMVV